MHLQSSFIILCLFSSVVKSQFFYNYEERDQESSDDTTPVQFNSPIRVSQQTSQPNKNTDLDPPNEPSEIITEYNKSQRPRRRMYRRIFREGTYVEPPTIAPRSFSRSVFENFGLGQAPSGVYIPQDSFLNVLKNDPPSHSSVSYVPEQQFFVQPPPFSPNIPAVQPNVRRNTPLVIPSEQNNPVVIPNAQSSTVVQPSVHYVPENSDSSETKKPASRNNRRQRVRPSSRPDPMVDIDVLRTPPDMTLSNTPVPFQGMRTQGRSVSRSRAPLLIDNYQETTQRPQKFTPSAFQNIGLGEAPQGVSIPTDSLLNVLRNTQPPSVYVAPTPRPAQISPDPQEQELSPVEMPLPNSRRRSRQRSGDSTRVSRRRSEYQTTDQTQDMEIPEIRPQPKSSSSSRTSRRRTEAWYDDGSHPLVQGSEPQRTRSTVSRTSTVNRNREERRSQTTDKRQFKAAKLAIAALPEDEDDDGIPGLAGIDHPNLHTIPRTGFRCGDQIYNGYYADLETSCQVVHLCQAGGVKNSFLCPNGTIFNQEKFSCQWWYKVNCADSPKFYNVNDSLYKVDNRKINDKE